MRHSPVASPASSGLLLLLPFWLDVTFLPRSSVAPMT